VATSRDQEIVVFHYVLGVALANWSRVENGVRRIMVSGFAAQDLNHEALSVGFFSLEGFRARLRLADSVISRKLAPHPQHHDDWKALAEKAKTISRSRNKLAHWSVGKYWDRKPGLRIVLTPWVYKKPKRKTKKPMPPEGSLTIREIYRLSLAFLAFATAMDNFLHRIAGKPEPNAKEAERPKEPPSFDELAREIRDVFTPASG
jgi:hypothetical protein